MDEYTHGREHARLDDELRDVCARMAQHLIEHEGLAVPHHSHTVGADVEEALRDLAGAGEAGEAAAEEPAEVGEANEEAVEAKLGDEGGEANEEAVEAKLGDEGEEPPAEEPPAEEHAPTVDSLIPAEDGQPEGEPKRAHPMFHRVWGE